MSSPTTEDIQAIETFLEQRRLVHRALSHLREGKEISVKLDETPFSLFHRAGKVMFQQRDAVSPDVEFWLGESAYRELPRFDGDDVGEFGILVLKHYIDKNIRIRVLSSTTAILFGGYLGVMTEGGAGFARFLAEHGISNLKKIPEIIGRLKR